MIKENELLILCFYSGVVTYFIIMKLQISIFFFFLLLSCHRFTDRVDVLINQPTLPVLTMKKINPVLQIMLIRQDSLDYELEELSIDLDGTTDLSDIKSIALYGANKYNQINAHDNLGEMQTIQKHISFNEKININTDTFTFWVSLQLKDKVDLLNKINISCSGIRTTKGNLNIPLADSCDDLRLGVAVRQQGQDGVNTSRIPGLVTSKKGTLLAIYDARWDNARDLQGDMDIALNRSFDGGETWEPIQIILDMKEWGGLPQKYNGVSDANILVDEKNGDIYVAALWMHGVLDSKTGRWVDGLTKDSTRWIHQWQGKGSQPGLGVKETSQFIITKSTDDGATWSEPMNITAQTKHKAWCLFAPAPGHGITLTNGTLVFPSQGRDANGLPFSNITWSNDEGKTWTTSTPAYYDVTESMVVQLTNGSLMLNMRDNRNRGNLDVNGRRIAVTNDLGKTWTEHPTSRKELIEPTCMASIHKHIYQHDGETKTMLVFANPASKTNRDHITVKVSFDDGNSWSQNKTVLLDQYEGRGYSCLTSVNDSILGILYESSQADMVFQKIAIEDLI